MAADSRLYSLSFSFLLFRSRSAIGAAAIDVEAKLREEVLAVFPASSSSFPFSFFFFSELSVPVSTAARREGGIGEFHIGRRSSSLLSASIFSFFSFFSSTYAPECARK